MDQIQTLDCFRRGDPPGERLWVRQRDRVPRPPGGRVPLQAALARRRLRHRIDGTLSGHRRRPHRGALQEEGPHRGSKVSGRNSSSLHAMSCQMDDIGRAEDKHNFLRLKIKLVIL